PGLEIAAGWRPRCQRQDLLDRRARHRPAEKGPRREPAGDRLRDRHHCPLPEARIRLCADGAPKQKSCGGIQFIIGQGFSALCAAAMWLLAQALQRLIKRGPLTVIGPDGNVTTYGAPDPGLNPVTVRFTDAGVARQIASDPGLGAAEAWMDGRLRLEQGDLLDLVQIIRRNNP